VVDSEQNIRSESGQGQKFYSFLQAVELKTGHLPEELREKQTEISIRTVVFSQEIPNGHSLNIGLERYHYT
jgi:hypothetical protein